MSRSYNPSPFEAGSNLEESPNADHRRLHDTVKPNLHFSPENAATQILKRIPKGTVTAEIPLEAAKAFPTRIWTGTGIPPRIAYADLNTHHEENTLSVKLLPDGGKTAPHPQIVFFVTGAYHVETLGYHVSDPYRWSSWMEFHFEERFIERVVEGLLKARLQLEGIQ